MRTIVVLYQVCGINYHNTSMLNYLPAFTFLHLWNKEMQNKRNDGWKTYRSCHYGKHLFPPAHPLTHTFLHPSLSRFTHRHGHCRLQGHLYLWRHRVAPTHSGHHHRHPNDARHPQPPVRDPGGMPSPTGHFLGEDQGRQEEEEIEGRRKEERRRIFSS